MSSLSASDVFNSLPPMPTLPTTVLLGSGPILHNCITSSPTSTDAVTHTVQSEAQPAPPTADNDQRQPTPTRTRQQIDDQREEILRQLRELEIEGNALIIGAQPTPPATTNIAASSSINAAPFIGIHPQEVATRLRLFGRPDTAALLEAPSGATSVGNASSEGVPFATQIQQTWADITTDDLQRQNRLEQILLGRQSTTRWRPPYA